VKSDIQNPGKSSPFGRYTKFLLYLVVVVLINLVGANLFTRIDLTANRLYSLSPISKQVVATLTEPLTFKVFFTPNLPAPYNGVERYVHDLLEEYALAGNHYFNFQFYNTGGEGELAGENQQLAASYGVNPVQIRVIDKDEVKFQKAYMGLAIIHGDLVESLPAITRTEGLEYRLTTTIRRMNDKISRLQGLSGKIKIDLYLSSSLQMVGPYLNLQGLGELPEELKKVIGTLNQRLYDRLDYHFLDPSSDPAAAQAAVDNRIMELKWQGFTDRQGKTVAGGHGYAGLVVSYGDQRRDLHLISAVKGPLFGTQYLLASVDEIKEVLEGVVSEVIGINEKIGWLADHGTLSLQAAMTMPGQPRPEAASNFNAQLSREYDPQLVTLDKPSSLAGIKTLIIARPTKPFSDYELYLLDQYLLQGNSLAVFYDPFEEKMPPRNMMMMGQGPSYIPLSTGLEKLLAHYGAKVRTAYVLDKKCYQQQMPQNQGGGQRSLYFVPVVQNQNINKEFPFISNIKGLIMIKAAPVEFDQAALAKQGTNAAALFTSSKESWLQEKHIDLNPMLLQPPAAPDKFARHNLAVLLEGKFSSYFKGQPLPEKPKDDTDNEAADKKAEKTIDEGKKAEAEKAQALLKEGGLKSTGARLDQGRGQIVVVGSSAILGNNVVDEEGITPNAQLLMNLVDHLNGRDELAVLRTKTQRFNPLNPVAPETRSLLKGVNLVGLPLLVILIGILAWLKRGARRRKLRQMFNQ
jgi:ABC-type uncharacterized transport system involved in gliding motility auxiliary subunit